MLGEKYAIRIKKIGKVARRALIEDLELDTTRRGIIRALEEQDHSPADVILTLVRQDQQECRRGAEIVMGKPIIVYLPAVPRWPPGKVRVKINQNTRRITFVRAVNPKMEHSRGHERFKIVQVGMTRQQLLDKGVTRRDLRDWLRHGHIEFEN